MRNGRLLSCNLFTKFILRDKILIENYYLIKLYNHEILLYNR